MDYKTQRARILKRTLGTRVAAGYLRNKGVELADALKILVGRDRARDRQLELAIATYLAACH